MNGIKEQSKNLDLGGELFCLKFSKCWDSREQGLIFDQPISTYRGQMVVSWEVRATTTPLDDNVFISRWQFIVRVRKNSVNVFISKLQYTIGASENSASITVDIEDKWV